MTLYTFLKFIHIVLAIVALGFNTSYALWLRSAARQPEHAAYVLRGIKTLDDRFATPAYILLLMTGIALVVEGNTPFTTFWILAALVLYGAVIVGGGVFYTPILRAQTVLAEAGNADSDEFRRLSRRGTVVGSFVLLLVFAIEFVMVTKPTL